MGDFNSQLTLWGCANTNEKGRIIEDFITKHDLILLNDKSSTYLHPATGSYSSLDLTICSPEFVQILTGRLLMTFMEVITFRSKYRKQDLQYYNVLNVGNFRRQTGNSLEFIANKQFIPMLSKIVRILQNFSLPYFIRLLKSQFLELRQIQSTKNKPWFNDDCKNAIAERKSILRQFNLRPTQENLSKFKIARAKARRTIKQSKRASWRQYVSRLNSRSSVKKTWDMIRKINGKNSSLHIGHLNVGDDVTSKADIAHVLADTFKEKSSSSNYSTSFQKLKNTKEKQS